MLLFEAEKQVQRDQTDLEKGDRGSLIPESLLSILAFYSQKEKMKHFESLTLPIGWWT